MDVTRLRYKPTRTAQQALLCFYTFICVALQEAWRIWKIFQWHNFLPLVYVKHYMLVNIYFDFYEPAECWMDRKFYETLLEVFKSLC